MAWSLRMDDPGAVYHVMNWGQARLSTFRTPPDLGNLSPGAGRVGMHALACAKVRTKQATDQRLKKRVTQVEALISQQKI